MKRLLTLLLTVTLAFSVTACGDKSRQNETSPADEPTEQEQETPGDRQTVQSDAAPSADENADSESADNGNGGGILIAYFSAAENSGVDAVSSASYSMVNGEAVGRLSAVANMIQRETGGDLFSIRTSVVYPADGGELIEYAAREQDENARPELTSHIENLEPDATVITDGFTVNEREVPDTAGDVANWLEGIGY